MHVLAMAASSGLDSADLLLFYVCKTLLCRRWARLRIFECGTDKLGPGSETFT